MNQAIHEGKVTKSVLLEILKEVLVMDNDN